MLGPVFSEGTFDIGLSASAKDPLSLVPSWSSSASGGGGGAVSDFVGFRGLGLYCAECEHPVLLGLSCEDLLGARSPPGFLEGSIERGFAKVR